MAAALGPLAAALSQEMSLTSYLKYIIYTNFIYFMAAALVPPTKSAHLTYEICPSTLRKMPIRPTKNAHPTYKSAHADLQN